MRVLTVLHIHAPERVVDDCGVLLLNEVVLGEALDVEDEEWRELCDFEPAQDPLGLLGGHAVVLGEDVGNRDLGDDVLLDDSLKHWPRWQVDCEEQEWRLCRFDFCGQIEGTHQPSASAKGGHHTV